MTSAYMTPSNINAKPQSSFWKIAAVLGSVCIAFVFGIGLTIGYIQWSTQKSQIAELVQQLETMQVGDANDVVTRNASPELLAVAAIESSVAAPAVAQAAIAQVPVAPAPDTFAILQDLVSKSGTQDTTAPTDILDAAGLQTIAQTIQGVDELIEAARAGDYIVQAGQVQADGLTSQQRLVFPAHAETQEQVEQLLALTALRGVISFNEAARDADGSIDGQAILMDIVADAL